VRYSQRLRHRAPNIAERKGAYFSRDTSFATRATYDLADNIGVGWRLDANYTRAADDWFSYRTRVPTFKYKSRMSACRFQHTTQESLRIRRQRIGVRKYDPSMFSVNRQTAPRECTNSIALIAQTAVCTTLNIQYLKPTQYYPQKKRLAATRRTNKNCMRCRTFSNLSFKSLPRFCIAYNFLYAFWCTGVVYLRIQHYTFYKKLTLGGCKTFTVEYEN
jgi:hypothetical protein